MSRTIRFGLDQHPNATRRIIAKHREEVETPNGLRTRTVTTHMDVTPTEASFLLRRGVVRDVKGELRLATAREATWATVHDFLKRMQG